VGVTDLPPSIAIDRSLLYPARRDGPPPIEKAFHCRSLSIENFAVTRKSHQSEVTHLGIGQATTHSRSGLSEQLANPRLRDAKTRRDTPQLEVAVESQH